LDLEFEVEVLPLSERAFCAMFVFFGAIDTENH